MRVVHVWCPQIAPPHTQKSESRPRRPFVECLGVGGVPQQLWRGGSKDWPAESGGVAGYLSPRCWGSDCRKQFDQQGSSLGRIGAEQ